MPVKTVPAREAKYRFGALLDTAQREPVRITKKNRPVAVVLSGDNYETYALTQAARETARKNALRRLAALPEIEAFKNLSEEDILALVDQEINASRNA